MSVQTHSPRVAEDAQDEMPQSSAVQGASRAPLYYSANVPSSSALPTQVLNGASNLIPRFGLLPLYLTAVKPYRRTASDEDPSKIRKLNFTYEHYVEDLPGRVKPTKFQAKQPPLEPTMRDIVFRPETTLQRIIPFDEDTLQGSFAVEAGPAENINAHLLEADEPGQRRPKKRKQHRQGNDQASPRKEAKTSEVQRKNLARLRWMTSDGSKSEEDVKRLCAFESRLAVNNVLLPAAGDLETHHPYQWD